MNESGSAIVSAIAGITMATLIALSTLALGMSAMNTLIIRDAAIEAAQRSALAQGQPQKEYLLKLLTDRLPSLASFEVSEVISESSSSYQVNYSLPGLGAVGFLNSSVIAVAAREVIL